MKKIFLFLSILISFFSYGQAEFPEGVQITGGQPTNTTPTFLTATSPTGVQEKIPSAYIEKTANKTSTISGYSETLYPNEKASHDALALKLNISDLPTNLTLYPTTTVSDVSGYVVMVKDIHDVRYNSTAVDVSTPTITTTDQLVSQRITDAGVLIGQPGVFNITTFGNIRRLSGSGTATFYFEVYHRDLAGVETLICTSSISNAVVNGTYAEFTASGVWDDGDFVATDRIVIKSYANRIAGGSDPVYQFQFGGASPVRTLLPVPFSVVDAGYELRANKQNDLIPDGTGTKYPTVDAVNNALPTSYSKIVYVNTTSPTTATIFDLENPPVTNDNLLKNDDLNLYIGTDASTWVYLAGTGYVTKTISSATSNFYNAGTTIDAGNSKTSHITRSGNISTTGKLSSSGATTLSTTSTETAYVGTTTSNPDLAKFVVKGTKSGTGSHYIASFLNDAGVRVAAIDDFGRLISSYEVLGTAFVSGNGGRFKSGTGGGLETTTGKIFIESATGWKSFHVLEYESVLASTYNAKSLVPKDYVDAKITQTITNGVTDKSPSEDAVYDALSGHVKNIVKDAVPSTPVTGTLSETILKSYLIPANTFSSSDLMNIPVFAVNKAGVVGTANIRIYINTTNSLSGAVQLFRYNMGNTLLRVGVDRHFRINGGNLMGLQFSATTLLTDIGTSTVAESSTPITTSSDFYIITTAVLSDATDSISQSTFLMTN